MTTKDARDRDTLAAAIAAGGSAEFVFFWGCKPPPGAPAATLGPWVFSQWYPASFVVNGIRYPTAEHWMMAAKAMTFNDLDIYARVIDDCSASAPDPRHAKLLGRQVKGFDQEKWLRVAFEIVTRGNVYKFGQNPELGMYLRNTGDRILVEASPRDAVWGIGMSSSHPDASNPARWPGLNMLGFALVEARHRLSQGSR